MEFVPLERVKKLVDKTARLFKNHVGAGHTSSKLARKHVQRGRRLYNAKSYGGAIEEFRSAIAIDPKYARALYYLGNALYKTDQFPLARRYWEQCIDTDPSSEFAGLSQKRIQHLDKQRQAGKDALTEFYRQVGKH